VQPRVTTGLYFPATNYCQVVNLKACQGIRDLQNYIGGKSSLLGSSNV